MEDGVSNQTNVLILKWQARIQSPRYWLRGAFRAPFGSCFMRGDQFAALVSPHLDERITLTTGEIGPRPLSDRKLRRVIGRNRIVILTKHAAERAPGELVWRIREAGALVGVDHVDSDLDKIAGKPFDFHVSATMGGAEELRRRFGPEGAHIGTVLHHADPRIRPARDDLGALSAAYLGKLSNCLLPEDLEAKVTMLRAMNNTQMRRALRTLPDFNLHYAVRTAEHADSVSAYKPFTKGFNAAAADSNIIVTRDTDDAEFFLGRDYPFLVDQPSESAIIETFRRAQESFGTAEWRRGLAIMRSLRALTSPASIARQFQDLLRAVAA